MEIRLMLLQILMRTHSYRSFEFDYCRAFFVLFIFSNFLFLFWTVKQFIEVFPVTFPNGEPTVDTDPSRILLKQNGECVILDEDSELVKNDKKYEFMGYRRCTGCIEAECENIGMCRKLYWSSMSSPIKREAPHMWTFKKVGGQEKEETKSQKSEKVSLLDKYKFSSENL